MQNHSDTNPKANLDSETQDIVDSLDMSLQKSRLQENDPELAPLFKLVLPPV